MTDRTCACGADLRGLNPAVKQCGDCHADIMRAAGVEPLEPYPGSNHRKWKCRCLTCGETVEPEFANVQQGHRGCNYCALRASAATRSHPEDEAVAVMRAARLEPLEPYRRSQEQWKCRCMECGAVVTPTLHNIRSGWGGCWTCRCRRQSVAQLADELEAIAVMQAAGLEPLEPYQGTNVRWRSRCVRCERTVRPRLHSVKAGNGGCRYCGSRFTAFEDALVYLIEHPQLGAAKIGITKARSYRLTLHRNHGWRVLETGSAQGVVAMEIESRILSWWRDDLGLPPCLGPDEMPQGGWTETVALSEIDLAATISRMRRPIKREEVA